MKPTWLTIKTNPPKFGYAIVVRTADKYGYGHNYDVIDYGNDLFNQEEYEDFLSGTSFIEWMPLEEKKGE